MVVEYWDMGDKYVKRITKADGSINMFDVEKEELPKEMIEKNETYFKIIEEEDKISNFEKNVEKIEMALDRLEEKIKEYKEKEMNNVSLSQEKEMVEHPIHYGGDTTYECIKVLQSWLTPEEFKGFLKGNAIKYLCRVGKKDEEVQELKKVKWYVDKLIETY